MSTAAEIESAIERLPASEARRLRDWLLSRPAATDAAAPKTGAELARLWTSRFHLNADEAEALAVDVAEARARQTSVHPSAWE